MSLQRLIDYHHRKMSSFGQRLYIPPQTEKAGRVITLCRATDSSTQVMIDEVKRKSRLH